MKVLDHVDGRTLSSFAALALALVLVAAVAAGCGGSGAARNTSGNGSRHGTMTTTKSDGGSAWG
jgi:hypothetical protein